MYRVVYFSDEEISPFAGQIEEILILILILTSLSIPAVIAATVVKVSEAAVPG